jgi:hypothetical protein
MVWAGPSMDSGTNHMRRSVDNAGGTTSSSANGSVVGSVGEEVAFTTAASAGNVVRGGWSELHAFPRTVTDLGGTNLEVSSVTLQWTTPGYDGGNGTLQVGSTYFIRIASYTVPDTFANPSFANISFTTSGVIPGEVVSIKVLGLQFGTTYYARIWTTDGDSNVSYESNLSSFVMKSIPLPSEPTSGSIVTASATFVTGTWALSPGATSYLMIVSTNVSLLPVYGSSSTAASTGTVSGLVPNTTHYAAVSACNEYCSPFTSLGSTLTLAAPALSLSLTGVSSSTIDLAWDPNGNPANTRFVVRSSTDNTAFFSVATVTTPSVLLSSDVLNGVTYYLEVVALNSAGTSAPPSNRITVLTPVGPTPSAPSGAAASALLLGCVVSWDALPPAGVGTGLLFYRVSRSMNAGFGYVSVTTTNALSFTDRPLTLGVTYYYRVTARDIGDVEGPSSGTASAFPFNIAPMEPIGMTVVPAATSISFSWTRTTRFGDGTIFISTSVPLADELLGYAIYRSTELCTPSSYVHISSLTFVSTQAVDNTGGNNYYYHIQSYNSLSLSTSPTAISTLGERSYFLEDCASRIVLNNTQATALNAASNSIGDVRIEGRRIAADLHDSVYQSGAWRAMLEGVTPMANFTLPSAVRIVLHFDMLNGAPYTPSGTGPNSVSVKNLGMYWYNGGEFKKVYGTVDPVSQTVTVDSPNLGNYQIRALMRAGGLAFDGTSISGRAITPNGDGLNDTVIFTYDPGPNNEVITGTIYDVMGQFVSNMRPGQVPNTLIWDGRSNGRTVGSGAYIYRLAGGGRSFTGTLVVAR